MYFNRNREPGRVVFCLQLACWQHLVLYYFPVAVKILFKKYQNVSFVSVLSHITQFPSVFPRQSAIPPPRTPFFYFLHHANRTRSSKTCSSALITNYSEENILALDGLTRSPV
jgi:hypothetical protein